ncbi:Hypothetical_protein [Hexamita inflata]|uniref:Hypothetical_protein n=1 Tax=Hexamita inflata TaxID=28002 RepID=A0AA86PUW2_9EUKA|nr:Hypothetical protein HINF_LOCUS29137 [Hexamita inflata]
MAISFTVTLVVFMAILNVQQITIHQITNKNYCKRRVGFDSLSGDGYYSKKGRYKLIKYVYGLDDQLVGPATMFINKGYSYRVIKFYGEHDKGEFCCKETKNVQRKVKYTAEQERIILEKVQKHNLFDQIITLW